MTVVYILLIVVIFLLLLILIRQNLYTRSRQNPQLDLQVKQLFEEQQRMEKRLQDANFQLSGSFNQANERVLERYGQFERVMRDQLNQHTSLVNQQLQSDFSKLNERIEFNLLRINDKVNERLDQSFNKTNETFQNILVRLAKIDEAQKKIESLSTDIVSLQNLLSDKKSRGTFGEVQLYQIMAAVFGEKNDRIYETQYKLSNGTIVDAMLHAPLPMGDLPIDSKFPLENYQRMMDRTLGEVERQLAEKQFKQDVKKHIDDIFNKYVTPQETSDQAVMFLPAEAIFAEINAYHPDLVAYSQRKRVWLVSPTTFMSTLTTIQVILNNLERDQHALIIQQELNKLGDEFKRYKERWDKLSKHIDSVSKDVKEIHITTEKIGTRFDAISNVELDFTE
ncbi:DNA recombination protein RmuC [Turicibacter sanguinis]|uniref:DNA recombination protein RmuC n=1 Tax=Turicibacter TaxID=191303 RepID=UPI0001FDB2C6|nr:MULTISPECIES: DNA recombination protein RmuC [Turicibacter]EGC93373.1 RmuC domain protein [Turicibacter sp. HGF1]MDB8545142.1 DNA recombination protein RmuC [Turicibacter sanguinis]MDB8553331.1 DNA recombination protein RmuC [Turicibacter sanguinis]MDB8558569.1 DNA recombination protein RmuC [Turicibacter sanguinis]MDB8561365.1 DNA recombination protein RmuC [Turicibacter sanguinis]